MWFTTKAIEKSLLMHLQGQCEKKYIPSIYNFRLLYTIFRTRVASLGRFLQKYVTPTSLSSHFNIHFWIKIYISAPLKNVKVVIQLISGWKTLGLFANWAFNHNVVLSENMLNYKTKYVCGPRSSLNNSCCCNCRYRCRCCCFCCRRCRYYRCRYC